MINLLHALGSNKQGGAELFSCRLAIALNAYNLNQAVVLRENGPYVNTLSSTIPCFPIPFRGLIDLHSKRKLKQIIKNFSPDIVLSYMSRASQLVSQLNRSKNYIHIARLGGYYDLKYYRHCDHFIVNTKDLADYLLKQGIAHERVHHLYNFANQTPGKKMACNASKKLIVAVGRLHKNKAFDTLIHAIQHCNNTILWIAGEGPEREHLSNIITQLKLTDRVSLLGWVKRPEDLIASCDLFVCPSRHEPLGNVILEAWAQQKPILCTQSQGGTELIEHGETGWLVPIDQPKKMTAAIQTLLSNNDLLNTLALNGWQHYHQYFSESVITQQYVNLFKQLLSA
tara:strand:- start:97 stop:1119 length:1023 start_codon:yes stop_codon:yes gene_type:complete